MDATLAILGGAALALYYLGKKKINELQSRIDTNNINGGYPILSWQKKNK